MASELTAPELRPPDSRLDVGKREHKAKNRRTFWIWLLLTALLAAAIAVLFALPKYVAQKTIESSVNSNRDATVKLPATQEEAPVISSRSHDAAEALKEFLRLRAEPALARADSWAPADWQKALDTVQAGDDHYGRKQFTEALSAYKNAGGQLKDILASRPQRFDDYLSAGQEALLLNQSDAAIEALELALAMTPDHAEAAEELARAKVREDVLSRMQTGQQAEQSNDPDNAAVAYAEAVGLDAKYRPAQEALDRVNNIIARLAFDQALSSALENLEAGNFSGAKKHLDTADKLNPGDPGVADTRQRLRAARRQAALTNLRQQAKDLVAKEDWKSASDVYRNALQIDAEALFAITGLALAEDRISLHAQLDHYLADPGRLSSDEPLTNAKKLIEINRNIPESEPRLASKINALGEAIHLAELPVTLLLKSDNQTEITIYHVGKLGKFFEKSLTLKPGSYTVTGFCPGYRDVRQVVELVPGSSEASLFLRCEELI